MPLHVELVTPEKVVSNQDVDFIAVPTVQGELGILPRHAPLLASLQAGPLRLGKGEKAEVLAVTGGFIEVREGSQVSIFAETAEFAHDIDVERARLAAERAKTQLNEITSGLTPEQLSAVEASLARAQLRIKIGEGKWRKQRPEMPTQN
jgi:F-type H+-transporting ATPase subunit epsilon